MYSAEGESLVTLSLAPSLGYFVADGVELSVAPELGVTSSDGDTDVVLSLLAGPSYHFATGDSVVPFIGASAGFIKFPDADPRGLLGIELGLKVPVGGGGLVRPQLRLLVMTGEPTIVRLGALAGVGIFF